MAQRTRDVGLVGGGLAAAAGERERGADRVQAAEIVADNGAEDRQRAGGAGLVAAEARELAGLAGSAAGTGRGLPPGRRRARREAG